MGRTKVVGIAGRFGPRYGSSLRFKWKEVMDRRYARYTCPFCKARVRMKRLSVGLWQCPKCHTVFTGGAYVPVTEVAGVTSKQVPSTPQ
ncbi:MAG: 50S ribosomal protein L37ae [Zestosphaera tikiterensis]|uniref:Large ribosomal subunit protein eL43 n=1 Tax=Zestosphaera tikiterensis TaxID=1973259 RepID=A0A2R7Y4I8_9CREN|nr:MAG: 50S ribosomal protein L37ae [Zestosphaera tikiterensis]